MCRSIIYFFYRALVISSDSRQLSHVEYKWRNVPCHSNTAIEHSTTFRFKAFEQMHTSHYLICQFDSLQAGFVELPERQNRRNYCLPFSRPSKEIKKPQLPRSLITDRICKDDILQL